MVNLSPPDRLDNDAADVWREVVAAHSDPAQIIGPALEAYCGQVAMQRDARSRIAKDGAIIDDGRGKPITHPAIALEARAQSEIRAWGDKFVSIDWIESLIPALQQAATLEPLSIAGD